MKILINDIIQGSNAPSTLKSPALAEIWKGSSITILLGGSYSIDCFGIGNTDATEITINAVTYDLESGDDLSGLYEMVPITASSITLSHNGTYIGRFGIGKSRFIGVAPAREPKWKSTYENRRTLSGQVVPGAGGYTYREIDVDVRYKIDSEILADIKLAYPLQIGRMFPLFIFFDKEQLRIPFVRMYASMPEDIVLQSGVNRLLYSKKFTFREEF